MLFPSLLVVLHVVLGGPRLDLSPAARASLLVFSASPTERLGCLIGGIDGETVRIDSVVVTDDSAATSTRAVARTPCPEHAVGRVHSHPGGERCWYFFPGTRVETSDAVSFRRGGYAVDAIVCGAALVWVSQSGDQQIVALVLP